jgi:hypothetical protein
VLRRTAGPHQAWLKAAGVGINYVIPADLHTRAKAAAADKGQSLK